MTDSDDQSLTPRENAAMDLVRRTLEEARSAAEQTRMQIAAPWGRIESHRSSLLQPSSVAVTSLRRRRIIVNAPLLRN